MLLWLVETVFLVLVNVQALSASCLFFCATPVLLILLIVHPAQIHLCRLLLLSFHSNFTSALPHHSKFQSEDVIEFRARIGQINLMGKDMSDATLQEKEYISTERLTEERVGHSINSRQVWSAYNWARGAWGQEGCLKEGTLHLFQVGFPEL